MHNIVFLSRFNIILTHFHKEETKLSRNAKMFSTLEIGYFIGS